MSKLLLVFATAVSLANTALQPEDVAVVIHSGHPDRRNYTEWAKQTWLRRVPRYVIIDGMQAVRRQLLHVFYDDNPGCAKVPCVQHPNVKHPHYMMIGKYFGAHRTIAGVLVANDTWPDAKWVLVVDDDDGVQLEAIWRYLDELDASVPLLLAGRIGPGHDAIPCRPTNNASHWSCCTDARSPCRAHLYGPQAVWEYDKATQSFAPRHICPDHEVSNYCCRSKPWPDGIHAGFPFQTDPEGAYRPHFSLLWPYGGLGYVLSRGLLDLISRDYWQMCMYAFQVRACFKFVAQECLRSVLMQIIASWPAFSTLAFRSRAGSVVSRESDTTFIRQASSLRLRRVRDVIDRHSCSVHSELPAPQVKINWTTRFQRCQI